MLMSKNLYNRGNIITKYHIAVLREKFFAVSVSWWRIYHPFNLDPESSFYFLDKFKTWMSLRLPCINKWGSDEEQLGSNISSQSTLFPSCCLWSSLASELSSLKVIFSRGFGTGNFSLYGTGLIAGGIYGYCTVCLNLEVLPVMFVKHRS